MQDVHVKVNQDCHGKSSIQQEEEDSLHQQIGLIFKDVTSKMPHLEYSFVWYWNLDNSKSRSEISGKFWNVVLEKDGQDQLDQSREKWKSVINSQGREEYPTT